MHEFLTAILAFPTVMFTGMLGLAVVYWVFVIVGAIDVDLLDPGHAADGVADAVGALKGVAEGASDAVGALKGVAEGASHAAGEAMDALVDGAGDAASDAVGALKGVAEGATDAAGDAVSGVKGAHLESAKETAGLLGALKLKDVPVTVTGSLLLLWSWAFSYLGMYFLAPVTSGVVPDWLLGLVVMVAAVVVAYPVAALSARPFAGVFATEVAKGRESLVGQIVSVTTLRVDAGFGQASLEDGQGGLLVPVRCPKENSLQRGDDALVINYDPVTETFLIEPLDPALAPDDAARHRAVARLARDAARVRTT